MKKLFETGIKNMRKEVEKDREYLKPDESAGNDEKIEEIKDDMIISTNTPETKKPAVKKPAIKKSKTPVKKN
jgi:hypothetical protein